MIELLNLQYHQNGLRNLIPKEHENTNQDFIKMKVISDLKKTKVHRG